MVYVMRKIHILRAFFLVLPKLARVAPLQFALWQCIAVLHGLSFAILTPATQLFFERATALATGHADMASVMAALLCLAAAHVVMQILNGICNFIPMMYTQKAHGVFSAALFQKINRLTPIQWENTRVLDDINKALKGEQESIYFTNTILMLLTFYLPYFLFMALYLWRCKPLLVISLLLVFLPTLLTQLLRTKLFAKAEDASAPVRRELEYAESCIAGREFFKETRTLGAFGYFRDLFQSSASLLNRLQMRASVRADLAELGMKLLSLVGYAGILLLLLDALLANEISVGAFAAIFNSVAQMFSMMREIICSHFGSVAGTYGRVQNYLAFMQAETPERPALQFNSGDIVADHISFTYPQATQPAICDVSLTIHAGETVALVGENGSGKSTLARLLLGLYEPEHGRIERGPSSSSAVFQQYQRYQMTLRDNITISDFCAPAEDDKLELVSRRAGLDVYGRSFPAGLDTMLSREFDGVDLSGGQWQRVAIARGLFRNHELIVLDEPTAAIDPIEETQVYNRFAQMAKDKTALIITHRLGSVRLADRILVMQQGRLVQQGTHESLMAAGGEYARLYAAQEQWYESNS